MMTNQNLVVCNKINTHTHIQNNVLWLKSLLLIMTLWVGSMDLGLGQGSICPNNLIENPNLSLINGATGGASTFFDNEVPFWRSSANTPHHVDVSMNNGQLTCPFGTERNCLRAFFFEDEFFEGIFTSINFIKNDYYKYQIEFTAKSIPCDQSILGVSIVACNGMTNNSSSSYLGNPERKIIKTFNVNANSSGVSYLFQGYFPDKNYSQFEIVTSSNGSNINNVFNLSNITVNCETSSLTNIITMGTGLIQTFGTENANTASPFSKFTWTFDDQNSGTTNNTSFLATPNHIFSGPGTYDVCVTITDDNGCCATRCEDVVITDHPSTTCPITNHTIINGGTNGVLLSTLIANGVLPANSSTNNIYLKGRLIINVPYSFSGCQWLCDEGSEIVMNADLTLTQCNLNGCTKMWKGIFVPHNNKSLKLDYTTIRDAQIGINCSSMKMLTVTNSKFYNNITGIQIQSPSNGNVTIANAISGNEFRQIGSMLLPFMGQSSYGARTKNGIVINKVSEFTVSRCKFIDIMKGIQSNQSTLKVNKRSLFKKESSDLFSPIGISIKGGKNFSTIENTSFNGLLKSLTYEANGSLYVGGEKVNFIHNTEFTTPIAIEIKNSKDADITVYDVDFNLEVGTGLTCTNSTNSILNLVGTCYFSLGSSALGISLSNTSFRACNLKSNTFNTFGQNAVCIQLNGVKKADIINNNANGEDPQNYFGHFTNTSFVFAKGNSSNFTNGFLVIKSPDNTYCCNKMDLARNWFREGCGGTALRNNDMQNITLGHVLGNNGTIDAFISRQANAGNHFTNASVGTIFSPDVPSSAQNNKFTTSPLQADHKPDAFIPTNANNGGVWFDPIGLPSTCMADLTQCLESPYKVPDGGWPVAPPGDGDIRDTISDKCAWFMYYFGVFQQYSMQNSANYQQYLWDVQQFYFELEAIYGSTSRDCLDLLRAQININSATLNSWQTFANDQAQLQTLPVTMINELTILHDNVQSSLALINARRAIDSLLIDPIVLPYFDQLATQTLLYEQKRVEADAIVSNKTTNLINSISILSEVYDFHSAYKDAYRSQHKVWASDITSLTSAEINRLYEIGDLCTQKYGKAVYVAKILLHQINPNYDLYTYNYDCTPVTPRTKSARLIEIKVYPNPTTSLVTFELSDLSTDFSVEVYNSVGTLVGQSESTTGTVMIDMTKFPNGFYSYRVVNKDLDLVKTGTFIKL